MSDGKVDDTPKDDFAKGESEDTKGGLESNPTHPLQQAADDKVSKTV